MQLPLFDSPLAYPVGRQAAVDPKHIASAGLSASVVATSGSLQEIISGVNATLSTVSFKTLGTLGPSANPSGLASKGTLTISGIVGTLGAIFQSGGTVTGGPYAIVGVGNPTLVQEIFISAGAIGGMNTSPGFPIAANTPYFLAYSGNSTINNYVMVNLKTGQLYSYTITGSYGGDPTYTTIWLGNNGSSGTAGLRGNIATAMVANNYLSLEDLVAWAQAPWDFWYPPNNDQVFAELTHASTGSLSAAGQSDAHGAGKLTSTVAIAAGIKSDAHGAGQASPTVKIAAGITSDAHGSGRAGSAVAIAAGAKSDAHGAGKAGSSAAIAAAAQSDAHGAGKLGPSAAIIAAGGQSDAHGAGQGGGSTLTGGSIAATGQSSARGGGRAQAGLAIAAGTKSDGHGAGKAGASVAIAAGATSDAHGAGQATASTLTTGSVAATGQSSARGGGKASTTVAIAASVQSGGRGGARAGGAAALAASA